MTHHAPPEPASDERAEHLAKDAADLHMSDCPRTNANPEPCEPCVCYAYPPEWRKVHEGGSV